MPIPTAQQAHLPACSPRVFFIRSVKQEDMNTHFTVISLTRFGIKPESAAPEADALSDRPSEPPCGMKIILAKL